MPVGRQQDFPRRFARLFSLKISFRSKDTLRYRFKRCYWVSFDGSTEGFPMSEAAKATEGTQEPLSQTLESGDGFVAPRYRSGQRSADALLEAGRMLLTQISYEGLSVTDLCSQANLTKGAFYRRFETKDAFFLTLQRLALDDAQRAQAHLADLHRRGECGEDFSADVRVIVEVIRLWHLKHCGVLRASLQRRDHTAGGWQPFKEFARGFVDELAARLGNTLALRGDEEAVTRLRFGFQMMIGTMINAALNDPGPLQLADIAMTDALARMLVFYVRGDRVSGG
ncbi:TetR/AcrR family transcriptional regulator [Paraburkholderia bannensis]|uniref:TetR/AcrR family transcriptional regulator n=1 Tax=Paraburkholderia bannensis TaxID=765414 RepID=UPI002AB6F80E|nr:TetR/AcrR family transcriptional regulator [Paraburkholderia bannensis]